MLGAYPYYTYDQYIRDKVYGSLGTQATTATEKKTESAKTNETVKTTSANNNGEAEILAVLLKFFGGGNAGYTASPLPSLLPPKEEVQKSIASDALGHPVDDPEEIKNVDVKSWFGPAEFPGFYPPVFKGFYGSNATSVSNGRLSGPLGGLDGYGSGFKGPVGGVYGSIVGFNDGKNQGGALGGAYSTLLGTLNWGQGGFAGTGYFPQGLFEPFGYL